MLASFGLEVLFTNQERASVWKINVDENLDGRVVDYQFRELIGICTEGNIAYVHLRCL